MANWKGGFRRLAWVLTGLAIPVVGFVAYNISERQIGYRAVELTRGFPSLDRALEPNSVIITNVGIAYFPSYMLFADIDEQMKLLFDQDRHPEIYSRSERLRSPQEFAEAAKKAYPKKYEGQDAVEITKRVVSEYPVYRSEVQLKEYEVIPVYEKRPMWAAAITAAVAVTLGAVLHAVITLVAWIVAGFRSAPRGAA